MANLLAGLIGALVGVLGVVLGAVLTGRREHHKWLRDRTLAGAVDFLTAAGELYEARRRGDTGVPTDEVRELRNRVQVGRSSLLLLCSPPTAATADELARRIWTASTDDEVHAETLGLVRTLTAQVRGELGV